MSNEILLQFFSFSRHTPLVFYWKHKKKNEYFFQGLYISFVLNQNVPVALTPIFA